MRKQKKDKEEIRIPHFRTPADKLDPDVLNVGEILHERKVKYLKVNVSLEGEITHDSTFVPGKPKVREWDPNVLEFCQQLQSWKKRVSGSLEAFMSPEGTLVSFDKRIKVRF
jgi:hypothetical protein